MKQMYNYSKGGRNGVISTYALNSRRGSKVPRIMKIKEDMRKKERREKLMANPVYRFFYNLFCKK